MEKTTRRVTSVVSFVLALLTVLASCNVSLLTGSALTTQVTDLTELIVDSESVKLNSDSNSSYEEDEWITYEAPLYNSAEPVLLSDDVAGDINGDGRSTVVDSVALLQYLAGGDVACVYNAMDVNGDKQINKQDVGALIKYIVGFTKTVNMQPACVHTFADPIAVAVTCTEDGTREHYECGTCHVKFSDSLGTVAVTDRYLTVKASGHKEAVIPAVAATCVEKGATAGVKCKTCLAVLTAPQDVDPTGNHIYTDSIPAIKATVTTTGMTEGTRCSVCGNIGVNPVLVPALGTSELIYELTGDYYTVKGLAESCTADVIIIPAFYNGKPVKAIASGAFANRTHITEVIILSYESSANIKPRGPEVAVSGGVTEIGEGAFAGCTGLTDVDMGNCVENISNAAFSGCSSLENVNISENVSNIGEGSFTGCANLETVTLPGAVENIGNNAFAGCESLTTLDYQGTQEEWADLSKNNIWEENKEVKVSCYSEGLLMELSADGTYYIVAGIGECKDTELKLPAEYKGLPVTQIKASAFENNTTITSVSIPKSITFIGKRAFYGSTVLTKVSITDLAAWCSINFDSIDANPLYWAKNLYLNDKLVTDLVIGNEIESISDFAFSNCNIQSVTIGNGIKRIGSRAFEQCVSLTEIVIPDNVTALGAGVFSGCDNLTTAHIGNGIKLLSASAFRNCSKLTTVILGSSINRFGAGVFFGCTALTSVNIPAGVTSFYGECFYNCSSLASIKLPEGLQNIGDHTFYGCSALTEIVIPDSVTEIGANAFNSCTSLTKVTVGSGVETIGGAAFGDDTALTSVYIKDLAAWCEISFANISSNPLSANINDEIGELYVNGVLLTDLRIPEGVEKIGNYAFRGITTLKTVVIPEGVREIGEMAFAKCPVLILVELPASIQTLGNQVFAADSSIQDIVYRGTFAEWNKVQKTNWNVGCLITTPTIYSIGLELVENDNGYTVKGIGSCAESKIIIPEYYNDKPITAIENNAFKGASIVSVSIPKTVTSIGTGVFYGCASLQSIIVEEGNPIYQSVGNCLIETATKTLIAGCKNSVIPADGSVTSIGAAAFQGCTGLERISIPACITSIVSGAFSGCKNLNRVDISDIAAWCAIEFSNISANPLNNGTDLYLNGVLVTDLVIPSTVTSISKFAFFNCTSFKTISIGANVSSIGNWVFAGCDNVESITVDAANKNYHVAGNCLIQTTSKRLVSGFKTSVIPADGSVVTIGSGAFRQITSLKSIVIPASVKALDTFVFMDCIALESVIMTEGLVNIGQSVFSNCTSLTSVIIPNTVQSIGASAFAKCTALKTFIFDGSPSEWEAVTKKDNWNAGCTFEITYTKEDHVHTLVRVEAKAATCTEPGNIEYWYCSSCDWMEVTGGVATDKLSVILPATGHSIGEWTVVKEATKTENGLKTQTCSVCNQVVSEVIPYLGSEGLLFEINSNGTAYHLEGMGECTDTDLYIPAVYNGLPVTAIAEAATFPNTIVSLHIPASITKINYSKWGNKLTGIYITDLAAWCNIAFSNTTCNPLRQAGNLYLNGQLVTELILPEGLETIKFASFAGCESITSVVIPDSVKKIRLYAFERCTGLTSVNIPANVTSIENGVFRYCSNIETMTVATGNSAYHSVNNCIINTNKKMLVSGCKNSVLPTDGSITTIGTCAFEGCSDLIAIVIPNGVTTIDYAAFWQCKGLTSVVIPNSVMTINESAFYMCTSLESINIPSSVTFIGQAALERCSGLQSITVESGNTVYHSADNCLIETATKTLIAGCNNSVIPTDGSVISIVDYAFYGCKGLASVVIPEAVTSIGNYVFYNCSALTDVVIPNSVTSIGDYAFRNCTALTSITIPASVTSIGNYAFANCSALTTIIFDGNEAQWQNVTKGNSWNMSSKFTVICMTAEDGHKHDQTKVEGKAPTCTESGLTEGVKCSVCGTIFTEQTVIPTIGHTVGEWTVTTPATKTENGVKSSKCTVCGAEVTVTIPFLGSEGLAFELSTDGKYYNLVGMGTCTDTDLYIPSVYNDLPVTTIPANASFPSTLQNIYIPASITSIKCKNWNSKLVGVYIYDLEAWCNISFASTSANPLGAAEKLYLNGKLVKELVIPKGIKTINTAAFYDCESITSVVLPDSVTRINSSAFASCTSLLSINIPKNVTTISSSAFRGCTSLKTITVDKENAHYYVLDNCFIDKNQKTIILGNKDSIIPADGSVTKIGQYAFFGHKDLTNIVLPECITSIGAEAFGNCSGLTSITIPAAVTSIADYVFIGCTSLESIVVASDNTVYHSAGNCLIETATKTLIIGCNNSVIPADGSVTVINDEAFAGFTGLTSIVIPEGVTTIGAYAFQNCEKLANVTISASVTNIGVGSFSFCPSLASVVIPTGVTSIESSTFRNCTSLTSVTIPASVTNIGSYAFGYDTAITTFIFDGTSAEWEAVTKETNWNRNCTFTVTIAKGEDGHTHVKVTLEAVAPTCTTPGLTEGSKCSVCGFVFVEQTEIPAGHAESEWITDKEPTATENGSRHKECTTCGETIKTETIPVTGTAGLKFELSADGTYYSVIGIGDCTDTDLYIPSVYEGLPVTTISKTLSLPATITRVHIPASITIIECSSWKTNLTGVYITDLAAWCNINFSTIYTNPLSKAKNLYINGVPAGELVIPEGVKTLEFAAFYGCESITRVVLPESLLNIDISVFYNCINLTSVSVPKEVEYISGGAFINCISLETITVDSANERYYFKDNCLIDKIDKILVWGNAKAVLPTDGSIISIGSNAFNGIIGLTSVIIPESVTIIRNSAFEGCKNLTSVVISKNVTSIGRSAFEGCEKLTSITIPASVKSIDNDAFRNCSGITEFIFDGSPAEWEAVNKKDGWNTGCIFTVTCTKDNHVHNLVYVEGKAATCTEEGNIEYWYCDSCDWVETTGGMAANRLSVLLAPTGHILGEWIVEKEATKTEEGLKRTTCTACGLEVTKYIQPIASEGLVYTLNKDGKSYTLSGMGTCTDTNVVIAGEYEGLPVTVIEQNIFNNYTALESLYIPDSITYFKYNNFGNSKNFDKIMISDLAAWCAVDHNGAPLDYADLYLHGELITDLVIPEGVIELGHQAFSAGKFNSVILPESLEIIGAYAFRECLNIKQIVIPENVISIGEGLLAFSGIDNIIVDPDNKTFAVINNCLINRSKKTLILGYGDCSIPNDGSVERIGYTAFAGNAAITEIVIPVGVKYIDRNAFENCANLIAVTIPDGVIEIGSSVFYNCSALTDIRIPASVTRIDSYVFRNCSVLERITVESGNTVYHSTGNCLIETATKTLIAGCNNSVIPADGSVTSIVEYAFYGCQGLKTIVIPEGVTSLGDYAFYRCSSLTSVVIPNSVTSIGNYAFRYCSALTSVTIPASVTTIGNCAFANCTALTTIIFDGNEAQWKNVTKGKNWNMSSKFTVEFMVAEDGHKHDQTKVEGKAPTCTESGLTEGVKCSVCGTIFTDQVAIPATGHIAGEWTVTKEPTKTEEGVKTSTCKTCGFEVTSYVQPIASEGLVYTLNEDGKSYTLSGMGTCTDTNVVVAGEYEGLPVTMIADDIFNEYTVLESLYVPASITYMGWSQFWNSNNFTKVMISDLAAWCGITFNGLPLETAKNLYLNGELVTVLNIPEGTTMISDSAFRGANITGVVIPESVTIIGYYAFENCTNLKEITIPKNVEEIGTGAFSGSGIESIKVDPENKIFVVVNNCLINVERKSLICGYGNCTIPNDGSVTRIENYAFFENNAITAVVIPDGVTYIGGNVFSNCDNLVSVVIPESVTRLGTYTFNNCDRLVSVNIPTSVTTIGSGTFQNCIALKSIIIPNSITKIDQRAFSNCTALESFIYDGTAAEWEAVTKGTDWNRNCKFTVQFMVAEDGHRHDQTKVDAVAPTCTKSGLTEGVKCSVCGLVLVEQIILPATGHVAGEWTVTKEPTKTEEGVKTSTCKTCGFEFTGYIQPVASEGLVYTLNEDGKSYTLSGLGTCTDTNVVIAGEYEGLPVTIVAENVFNGYTALESLYIPASITRFYWSQLWNCQNFTKIMISDLTAWCNIRFNISLLEIAHNLYLNGELVTDLVIPEGVKIIRSSAFTGANINSVILPESLESIYSSAFSYCQNLKEITISKNVTRIDGYAFSRSGIEKITVDPANTTFTVVNNCLIDVKGKSVIFGYGNCVIPNDGSVTQIAESAFANNSTITEMIIPEGITTIGWAAFENCINLKNVSIPTSVTYIDGWTFNLCESLNSVIIPATVTNIGNCAFQNCFSITAFIFDGDETQWNAVIKGENWNRNCTFTVQFMVAEDGHRHDQTKVDAVAPTCTKSGLTEGVKCSVCGLVLVEQIILPATGHVAGEWTVTKEPTKTEEGVKTSTCKTCGFEFTGYIQPVASEGLVYTLNEDGKSYTLSGMGTCTDTNVVIAGEYEGLPVTTVAEDVFNNYTTLESLYIPASITSFEWSGFWNCPNFTKVMISDLAAWCGISFDINPLEYAENLYLNGELVTNLVIPEGVTRIGYSAFSGARIESVVLPESLEAIGGFAFSQCYNLKEIAIPKNVYEIGGAAFFYCPIDTISVDPDNKTFKVVNNCLINTDNKTLICGYGDCVIPNDGSIARIANRAFAGNENLTQMVIPEGVTHLDMYAFLGCSNLTTVIVPNSIKTISYGTFSWCENIKTFIFDGSEAEWNNVSKDSDWNANCTFTVQFMVAEDGHRHAQTKVDAVAPTCTKSGLTEGIKCSVCGLVLVEQIILPATGHIAGEWTVTKEPTKTEEGVKTSTCKTCGFEFTGYIQPIASEGLVYTINEDGKSYTLSGMGTCTDTNVVIAGEYEGLPVTIVAENVFNGYTALESLYIPATITRFYWSDFWNCANFKKVMISDIAAWCNIYFNVSLLELDHNLYINGELVTDLVIPEGVKTIESSAFAGANINSVILPESLESIYSSAFSYCPNLKEITIPKNVTGISSYAFSGSGIEKITVDPANTTFAVVNNCLINVKEKSVIFGYGNCVIPSDGSVTQIAGSAFENNSTITEMIIPEGITTIGWAAFENCINLKNVSIPTSVTFIDSYAFNLCESLNSVIIPATVTNIGSYAFQNCINLTSFFYDGDEAQWEAVTKGKNWNRNSTFVVQFMVAADGHRHDQTKVDAVAPTCTESGLTEGVKCSVCGFVLVEQIILPATGHVAGEWTVTKEPTKTEEGVKTSTCKTCGFEFTGYIQPIASEGLVYTINEDGQSYTLSGMGTCTDTDVVIAGEYEGLPVTTIAENAFNGYTALESLYIPSSIKTIGWSQLWNCQNFTKVMISDLTAWCNIRFNISLLEIAHNLYLNGKLITDLVIPEGVKYINYNTFAGANINSVILPESLESIYSNAFSNCQDLKEITISKNVTRIDGYAFSRSGIEKITIDPANTTFAVVNNCLINVKEKSVIFGYGDCVIPNDGSVTQIAESAFANNSTIKEMIIPEGITTIGWAAFGNCINLKNVSIPTSMAIIDSYAFQDCINIALFIYDGDEAQWKAVNKGSSWNFNTKFTVQFMVAEDGHKHDKTKVEGKAPTCTESGLTEGVKCSVCGLIFCEQTVVPATGHTEGEWVVDKAPTNTEDGVKKSTCTVCGAEFTASIPWLGSEGLEFVLSDDGKYYILTGPGTCTDTEVYIPSVYNDVPVTTIAESAFFPSTVVALHIPASISSIGNMGIVIEMEDVYIYDLVAWCNISCNMASYSSGYNLYLNGQLVTDLVIPEGVKRINNYAFMKCASIKSVTIPKSLEHISGSVLSGWISLETVNVDAVKERYSFIDGCLIDKEDKTLIWGNADAVIPTDGSVTCIGDSAFQERTSLISITIPNGVTIIGWSAFNMCDDLTTVIIPNSVTSIGSWAFSWSTNLTNIIFDGTSAEWEAITKGENWNSGCNFTVSFTVGEDAHTHDITTIEAVKPTCTATGLTEGWHCSVCGLIFVEQTTINAVGHSFGNGACEICGLVLVIPEEYVDATSGYITTEDTVITTSHLMLEVPKNVYVMDNFVENVNLVTQIMERVSGMKFEGDPKYCNNTGNETHAKVTVVKPEGSECGPAYAATIGGAVISACDIVDLFALIHENSHVLQYRQSGWFFCTWAMESISTYTTYKTVKYILENHPELTLMVGTPNQSIMNYHISDYAKLYEHTMEYWMENTFEYSGNNNYSIGFRFAWFLDEVYGDYTKWIYLYEESRPYHSADASNTLPVEEQAKAFKMAYGENVFDEFYAWLKQNEYKFDVSSVTDLRAEDQINLYPQFMADEIYSISGILMYENLCFDLTGGMYYLETYQNKNIDSLVLRIHTQSPSSLLLFDAEGKCIRSEKIDSLTEIDISGVYYIILSGTGVLNWFEIIGF